MKHVSAVMAFLVIAIATRAAQGPSAVTYVDHDKVAAAIAGGGQLATGPNLTISMARRTGPGQVEIHDKETDTFYVLEGNATFVTGGTMVGGRVTRPGQQLGSDVQGGETHHLSKGDVIVIPAGTPHWFKEVSQPITYYMVKVVAP